MVGSKKKTKKGAAKKFVKGGEITEAEYQKRLARCRKANQEKDAELKNLRRQVVIMERDVSRLENDYAEAFRLRGADTAIPKWVRIPPKSKRSKASLIQPVLQLSDFHLDEVVDKRAMNNRNEFNREIAIARFERTINMTGEYMKSYTANMSWNGITVILGGDMISGDIHEELALTNEAPTAETVRYWAPIITSGLKYLADSFGRVFVPCIDGNHDRYYKKKPSKRRADSSWTWLLYHWIADKLKTDERINFMISRSGSELIDVLGTKLLIEHGDDARGGGGIGGIYPPLLRHYAKKAEVLSSFGQTFDFAVIGHFHQSIYGNRVIVNGALKGYDEYAQRWGFPWNAPEQNLFIVSPTRGITMQTTIQCE